MQRISADAGTGFGLVAAMATEVKLAALSYVFMPYELIVTALL